MGQLFVCLILHINLFFFVPHFLPFPYLLLCWNFLRFCHYGRKQIELDFPTLSLVTAKLTCSCLPKLWTYLACATEVHYNWAATGFVQYFHCDTGSLAMDGCGMVSLFFPHHISVSLCYHREGWVAQLWDGGQELF